LSHTCSTFVSVGNILLTKGFVPIFVARERERERERGREGEEEDEVRHCVKKKKRRGSCGG